MPIKVPINLIKGRFASGFYLVKPVLALLAERLDNAAHFKSASNAGAIPDTSINIDHAERVSMPALIQRHGRFETAVMCVVVENLATTFLLREHGVRGAVERTLPLVSSRAMDTFDSAYDYLLGKAHTLVDAAAKSLDDRTPASLKAPASAVAAGVDRGLRLALGEDYVAGAAGYVTALPHRASEKLPIVDVIGVCSSYATRIREMQGRSRLVSLLCTGAATSSAFGIFGASHLVAFTHVYTIPLDEEEVEQPAASHGAISACTTVSRFVGNEGSHRRIVHERGALVGDYGYSSEAVGAMGDMAGVGVYGLEGRPIKKGKRKETVNVINIGKEKNQIINRENYQGPSATCVEEVDEDDDKNVEGHHIIKETPEETVDVTDVGKEKNQIIDYKKYQGTLANFIEEVDEDSDENVKGRHTINKNRKETVNVVDIGKKKNQIIDYKTYQGTLAPCLEEVDEGVDENVKVEVEVKEEEVELRAEVDVLLIGKMAPVSEIGAVGCEMYQDFDSAFGSAACSDDSSVEGIPLEVQDILTQLSERDEIKGLDCTLSTPSTSSRSSSVEGLNKVTTSTSFDLYQPTSFDTSLQDEEDRVSAEISLAMMECCLGHHGHHSWEWDVGGGVDKTTAMGGFGGIETWVAEVEVGAWKGKEKEKEKELHELKESRAADSAAHSYPPYGRFFAGILNGYKENIPPSSGPSTVSTPSPGLTSFASAFVPKSFLAPMSSTPVKPRPASAPVHCYPPLPKVPVTIPPPAPPPPSRKPVAGGRKERRSLRMESENVYARIFGGRDLNRPG